jgi:nucleoside-diphosphate-sugar epimerase
VFGRQSGEDIDEAYPVNPSTPYGRSKLEAESLVREWGSRHGVMTTCLRLPLVYGPSNKGNVLRMIDAIARKRFLIIGKGDNKRSMVYVENVVDAAIAVAYREEADKEVFIVTDGTDYSILDLYQIISRSLGIRPLPLRVPASIAKLAGVAFDLAGKASGRGLPYNSQVLNRLTASLTFSAKRIEEAVGFRPRYDLFEGIAETVRWYTDRK